MSKLLIDDKPVMVLPKLAVAIGLNEAIVLQQIHYWLVTYRDAGKSGSFRDGRWWVYNTKREWKLNFPWWSENTIWRSLTSLRERGIVITTSAYNKKKYDKTLWYTIDYDKLDELAYTRDDESLYPKWVQPVPKMGTPIPEINTEINTEIKDVTRLEAGEESHREMVGVLSEVTGMDLKIKANAGRLQRASRELREAGYTIDDVQAFGVRWLDDWRYKKDKKPPALTIILNEIAQRNHRKNLVEQREQDAFRELEEARRGV